MPTPEREREMADAIARDEEHDALTQHELAVERPPHEEGCIGFKDARGEDEGICGSWCWGHECCEPIPKGVVPFTVCGECFHVFVTADDLLEGYNTEGRRAFVRLLKDFDITRLGEAVYHEETDANAVGFCPVCIHDF